MRQIIRPAAFAMVFLAAACSRTSPMGISPDGAVGVGGSGGQVGTGGLHGSGGGTGTTLAGTGGADVGTGGGSGGGAGVGTGGSVGTGGVARDAASPDFPLEVGAGGDARPSLDAADACGPGYPLGSSRPAADGCNTCVCGAGGIWACTLLYCPSLDAAVADKPSDGSSSSRDGAADHSGGDGVSASCSAALTEDACNLIKGCHSVFVEGTQCACLTPGCCMVFNRCAQGAQADCKGPATCKMMAPTCGTGFAVAYEGTCYEGCVRSATCVSS